MRLIPTCAALAALTERQAAAIERGKVHHDGQAEPGALLDEHVVTAADATARAATATARPTRPKSSDFVFAR